MKGSEKSFTVCNCQRSFSLFLFSIPTWQVSLSRQGCKTSEHDLYQTWRHMSGAWNIQGVEVHDVDLHVESLGRGQKIVMPE